MCDIILCVLPCFGFFMMPNGPHRVDLVYHIHHVGTSSRSQELWEEQLQMGKHPQPWPASGELPCPRGFPPSAFGDVVNAWAGLQLFGTLMHLKRYIHTSCQVTVGWLLLRVGGATLGDFFDQPRASAFVDSEWGTRVAQFEAWVEE